MGACRVGGGYDGVKYVSRRDPSGLAHVFFESVARGPEVSGACGVTP